MKVTQLMNENVKACCLRDSLNAAAQIMWDNDCGCVPVIKESSEVVGVLTDRDICMAAYTKGLLLRDITVESAMASKVISCRPEDSVATAETLMRDNQIRRLPVINSLGKLVGIVSLNDIALEAERERAGGKKAEVSCDEIGQTLGAVCRHRTGEVRVAA